MTPRSVLRGTPRWARDGGVGAHVQMSAAALAQRGVEVLVVAAEAEPGEVVEGVQLRLSSQLFDGSATAAARLGVDPGAEGVELAHLHQVDDPRLVDGLRAAGPVVVSAHGFTACPSGVYYFEPGQQCTRGHGPGCVPNLMFRGCAHTDYPKTLP